MTKYLDSAPFSSPANNNKYRDNYDKIFGKKKKAKKVTGKAKAKPIVETGDIKEGYSVCSAHQERKSGCKACEVVFFPEEETPFTD